MPAEHVPNTARSSSIAAKPFPGGAPALDRGLAILEALDSRPEGANLSQLSRLIRSPKNSTSRLIHTLSARGYLERDDVSMRFRLTGKLFRLGHPRPGKASLVGCALEAMRGLRDAVGETVQLGIPTGDEGVVIEQVESTLAVRICVEIGLRFPLYNTAPGKVLLAFQPSATRKRTVDRLSLERYTARTITTKSQLLEECRRVTELGYGIDWGEADEGIHCVAAPIFESPNKLLGVVWVSAVAGRMPQGKFGEVAVEVIGAARRIEGRLRS